jgi:hypothetical protein
VEGEGGGTPRRRSPPSTSPPHHRSPPRRRRPQSAVLRATGSGLQAMEEVEPTLPRRIPRLS